MTDGIGGEPIELAAADGRAVRLRIWRPASPVRGVVQVLHGLSEHVDRYARFAHACNERGFAVAGHNHRGHGAPQSGEIAGYIADSDGIQKVLDDVQLCDAELRQQFTNQPIILLGHSMGSYIAQRYVMERQPRIAGLALSGSTWPNRSEVKTAQRLAKIMRFLRGAKTPSWLFDKLVFGQYNQRFKPNRSSFDWLSRDADEVDRYVADALCGARATYGLWLDLFGTLLEISDDSSLRKVPAELPLLITGGELDPVGGKAPLTQLADAYRNSGHTDVTLTLYPEGRHEMLNELNRDAVTTDWLRWFDAVIGGNADAAPKAWR